MNPNIVVNNVWNGEEVKVRMERTVNRSVYELGLMVESQAKLLAPVNYGYLAASITTQSYDKGTKPENPNRYKGRDHPPIGKRPINEQSIEVISKPRSKKEVHVGTVVEYAPYVEYGTRKMRAQPYLRPSLDLVRGKTLTVVKTEFGYEFKEYLK